MAVFLPALQEKKKQNRHISVSCTQSSFRPCIHYIWSSRTLHSLYLVFQVPAFSISGLPGPCIHYIWSPRTLHSLDLVSQGPAFTISDLLGPFIHYIWSPRTPHLLYLVSEAPAFTVSGLPQYTEHENAIIFINTNC
ncbi:unnamed protein product [Staurois parvus]|uniref:Uncharacterized protein n=1 Tax=Staurois parvus TaxID=386267 RepID=A0ABN9B134_9NEOB|nr:unnamed protein product [Staurois parvus]